MDEPNALLRWVMFHFAGGDALFVALLGMMIVTFVPEEHKSAWRWTLAVVLCLIWAGLASPEWPWKMLILFAGLVLFWRIVVHVRERSAPAVKAMTWGVRLVITAAALLEITATRNRAAVAAPESVCVIADSNTAGLNDGEITWPRLLAERTGVAVRDASQPGATFRSAIQQAEALNDDQTPLVLEIGGNDLLGGRSLIDFSRDCEALCQKVCTPGRIVWMCELPLPPGKLQFGAAQRRIARKYSVRFVPKRKMMQLLTTAGATVDSIHLSPAGQNQFCGLMQDAIGCATCVVTDVRYEKIERRSNASAMRR